MKIVIDIPEEVYKEICDKNYYSLKGKEALRIGVINGTVLPKGHGRLIDADALNRKDVNCANIPMNFIDTAQTIIEADKS